MRPATECATAVVVRALRDRPFPAFAWALGRAALPPALLRAAPPFVALGLASSIVFGGYGMSPRDLVRLLDASAAARASLWAAWILVTAPAARGAGGLARSRLHRRGLGRGRADPRGPRRVPRAAVTRGSVAAMTNEAARMAGRKIGFIGGGNMAGALIRGLLAGKTMAPDQIRVSDVKSERLDELGRTYGVETTTDNEQLARWADVLVIAVKPQIVDRILSPLAASMSDADLVISIAAGVPIDALEARLPQGARVVRAMPNTAAIALAGATAIAPGTHATSGDLEVAKALFDAVGRCVVLDESLLDAVTGLSGSGPAYVMVMIEALADGGVKVGLGRDTALLLAAQTVYGAAKLQLETGEHPGRLKDMVTSPGGTAIAGLHTLESGGLRRTLIDAVEAASTRAAELGAQMAKKLAR